MSQKYIRNCPSNVTLCELSEAQVKDDKQNYTKKFCVRPNGRIEVLPLHDADIEFIERQNWNVDVHVT